MAPASRRRRVTNTRTSGGIAAASRNAASVVGMSAVSMLSFSRTGMPCREIARLARASPASRSSRASASASTFTRTALIAARRHRASIRARACLTSVSVEVGAIAAHARANLDGDRRGGVRRGETTSVDRMVSRRMTGKLQRARGAGRRSPTLHTACRVRTDARSRTPRSRMDVRAVTDVRGDASPRTAAKCPNRNRAPERAGGRVRDESTFRAPTNRELASARDEAEKEKATWNSIIARDGGPSIIAASWSSRPPPGIRAPGVSWFAKPVAPWLRRTE